MSGTLLLATRSAGKLRELGPMLAHAGLVVATLDEIGVREDVQAEAGIEAFDTFEANALAKARHFHAMTGRPTLADDSGLAVDALGGRPGVHSKRWSGRTDLTGRELDAANSAALMHALAAVVDRRAHYVCVAAYVDHTRELFARGEVHGVIAESPRGSGGFGYDPWFVCDELARTFGEASDEEKARVSHRARAVRALIDRLS